jgi:hypothetical protein
MKSLLLLLGTLICSQLAAQQPLPNLARPGAKGIFVLTGERISDAKGPVTAYRIERKAGDEKDFTQVAMLPATASVADFTKNMARYNTWLPYQRDLSDLKVDSIWKKGKTRGTLQALRAAGYSLPVLAGFNMIWLDATVTPGKTYQYRVSAVGDPYMALSFPILYAAPVLAPPQYEKGLYNLPKKSMQLYWLATGKDIPAYMELYRREGQGKFIQVPAGVSFLTKKDTAAYLVKDTTAQPNRLYQYYIKAWDALGNVAAATDTILMASLDYMQMPVPQQVKAVNDSTLHGIHISWQLKSPMLIKSVKLFRSTRSAKGFEPIAVLSPAVLEYNDQAIQPATAYFYYFETEYKTQDKPKRGIAFAASFTDKSMPQVPQNLQATGNKNGVELSWQYAGSNISGFWLYRAERGQPLQLLTTMIPAVPGQSDYTYTDTDSMINGARFYEYALKAFSTSHIESSFSDSVVARPLKNIPVPKPPMRIRTSAEPGLVLVHWDAVSRYDELVKGYKLVRSKKATGTKETYTTDTIFCSNNQYKDTLVKPNETIRYSVISQSVMGVQSVPSAWEYVQLDGITIPAPAAVAANPVKTGIQVSWDMPDGGETLRYNVYRFERGQKAVKTGSTNGQEKFIDTSALRGKQYYYYVVAIGSDQTASNRSNEAFVNYQKTYN